MSEQIKKQSLPGHSSPHDEVVEIPLTRGKVAIIDKEDWKIVSPYKWFVVRTNNGRQWYAKTVYRENGKQKQLAMSRLLMNVKDDKVVDFVDGNGLNLRRSNLRVCSVSQDQANRGLPKNNTSGFKGVSASTNNDGKWSAMIFVKGKSIRIGNFKTKEEAALEYDAAAKKYFGPFAKLNFPELKKAV